MFWHFINLLNCNSYYRIQIQPDFQNSTTHGMEMINLQLAEDTSSIIFHVNRIDIYKESVTVKKSDNSNSSGELPFNLLSKTKSKHYRHHPYQITRLYRRRAIPNRAGGNPKKRRGVRVDFGVSRRAQQSFTRILQESLHRFEWRCPVCCQYPIFPYWCS